MIHVDRKPVFVAYRDDALRRELRERVSRAGTVW